MESKLDTLIQNQLVKKVALSWLNLDTSIMEPFLDKDLHYSSFWVFSEISSKKEYLEYLRGKFLTIRNSGSKPGVKIICFSNGDYSIVLSQNGDAWLNISIKDGKIKRMDLTELAFARRHRVIMEDEDIRKEETIYNFSIGDGFISFNENHEIDFICRIKGFYAENILIDGCDIHNGHLDFTTYNHVISGKYLSGCFLEKAPSSAINVFFDSYSNLANKLRSMINASIDPDKIIEEKEGFQFTNKELDMVCKIQSIGDNAGECNCHTFSIKNGIVESEKYQEININNSEYILLTDNIYDKIEKMLSMTNEANKALLEKVFGYKLA